MRQNSFLVFLGALTVAAGSPAHAQPATPLAPPEEHLLANGLRVVLAPDPTLDDATVVVRYDVGSADDPTGKEGLAHVVEHMTYAASKHVPPGDYWTWVGRAGGWNASGETSLDDTSYAVTVPPGELPVVFWLESDRMGFSADALDAGRLEREERVILDELRDRFGDTGRGLFTNTGWRELFPPWHPYHRVPDLSDGIGLDDVRAFLRTWYTPRNATLIVTGRFDAGATLDLAQKYFGALPAVDPPARPTTPPRAHIPDVRVDMRGSVLYGAVAMMWAAPPRGLQEDAILDVIGQLLSRRDGLLQKELVSTGLAVDAQAYEQSAARGSAFVISATAADKVPVDKVVDAMQRVVDRLHQGAARGECEGARDEWIAREVMELETSRGRAARLSEMPWVGPWGIDRYRGIQVDDVERTAQQVLVPENRAVVVLRGEPGYAPYGVVVGRKERL